MTADNSSQSNPTSAAGDALDAIRFTDSDLMHAIRPTAQRTLCGQAAHRGWTTRTGRFDQSRTSAATICPGCHHVLHGTPGVGRWVREANQDNRFGTWCYFLDGDRWQLERRSGDHEDFGWHLFGPDGSPFGQHLNRRLPISKRITEDYAHDVPGARAWLRGDESDDSYQPPNDHTTRG